MKWITILIAIGSIVGGSLLYFWPKPPCIGHSLSVICLNDGFFEALLGFCTLVSGIVLLILISLANLRHRILSAVGAFVSFVIAILFLSGILFLIGSLADLSQFGFVLLTIGSIQAIAFLCTGLSASVIKNLIASHRTQPESSGNTL
jgi:hypothetical protein